MFQSSLNTIEQFKIVLEELQEDCYSRCCDGLARATIGQHTRHTIELYTCLLDGYESGLACYDKRERNKRIEVDKNFAIAQLEQIQEQLEKPNKDMKISYELAGKEVFLDTNYHREVMYNLEHSIHHHALIKVALLEFTELTVPQSFGIAPSTMEYRKQCVQ